MAIPLKLVRLILKQESELHSKCLVHLIPAAAFRRPGFSSLSAITHRGPRWTRSTLLFGECYQALRDHKVKFGWNYLRTSVDGIESQILNLQLFATVPDFIDFWTCSTRVSLRHNRRRSNTRRRMKFICATTTTRCSCRTTGSFIPNLTLNFGMRWDYDSEFVTKRNLSPRVGFAWSATPKTIIRGHFGLFYDQFRLGSGSRRARVWRRRPASSPTLFLSTRILRVNPSLAPQRSMHRSFLVDYVYHQT